MRQRSRLMVHVRCRSMPSAALSHPTHRACPCLVRRSSPTWPMLNKLAGGPQVLRGSLLPSSSRALVVATVAAALLGLRHSPSYRGRGGGGGGRRRRSCGSGRGDGQVPSRLRLVRLGGLGAHAGRRAAGRPPRAVRGRGPRSEMNSTRGWEGVRGHVGGAGMAMCVTLRSNRLGVS